LLIDPGSTSRLIIGLVIAVIIAGIGDGASTGSPPVAESR